MINRRGFLASALALGLAVALPLAPRPVRRWIASARARWARRRLWGDLSDAEIRSMLARCTAVSPARQWACPGALIGGEIADDGSAPGPDLGAGFRIADLPSLPGADKRELERTYRRAWGRERAQALRECHDRLPLDDPRFGKRT